MKVFPQVSAIPAGTVLPPNYRVKTIGTSRNQPALVYFIPNKQGGTPSTKRICESDWELAYGNLLKSGQFTLRWFEKNMLCAVDGQCGFRVTGEVFVSLGFARRVPDGRGSKFVLISTPPSSP